MESCLNMKFLCKLHPLVLPLSVCISTLSKRLEHFVTSKKMKQQYDLPFLG